MSHTSPPCIAHSVSALDLTCIGNRAYTTAVNAAANVYAFNSSHSKKRVGNYERAVEGSFLTAGKRLSEKSECNNSGYKQTGLAWWP